MKSAKISPTFLSWLGTAVALTAGLALGQHAEAQTEPAPSAPENELFADFLFIVDESGSMYTSHDWLDEMIHELEEKLQERGLGIGHETNRYGLVGFGNRQRYPHSFDLDPLTVGDQLFGNADQFAQTSQLLERSGGFEDGYAGIQFGLDNYHFRPGAAVNFVLISDEDRDVLESRLSFQSVLGSLKTHKALLNVVVNHSFYDVDGHRAVGADGKGNAFIPDGAGFRLGFYDDLTTASISHERTSHEIAQPFAPTFKGESIPSAPPSKIVHLPRLVLPPISPPVIPTVSPPYISYGNTTREDYVNLAWASEVGSAQGAAWDLNMLSLGDETVEAFTETFTTIKAEEAYYQGVPGPSGLVGLALFGWGSFGAKRRRDRLSATASQKNANA